MQIKLQKQPNLKVPPGCTAIGQVRDKPIAPDTLVWCGGELHLWNTVRQVKRDVPERELTAAFVRSLRGDKTQAEFGELVGKSGETVRAWESGKRRPDRSAMLLMVGMVT